MSNLLVKNSIRSIKVLKFFGFASVTIENEKCVTKPTDYLFFIGNFLIGSVLVSSSIKYRKELISTDSEIIEIGNFVTYVASIGISLISMVLYFFFRFKIWNMILQLKEVDYKFDDIGVKINEEFYENTERRYKYGVICIMMITLPLNGAVYITGKSFLKSCLYFYSGVYLTLSVGSVVAIINAARLRIKTINKVLESTFNFSSEIKIIKSKSLPNNVELIRAMMNIYSKIMKVYDSISICYGVPTMLGFGFLFFYAIFTSFMAYKDFSNFGRLNGPTIVSLMCSCYLHLFTSSVLFLCTSTEREAEGTLKVANSILKRSTDEVEVAVLISFSSFVKRRRPKFTCGLFDFDWTLLYSVNNKNIY